MDFLLLGPFHVVREMTFLDLGTRKQRIVLALLSLQVNRPVTLEQIIDELWGDVPPKSAVYNARQYAATLRRLFGKVEGYEVEIVRAGSGYQLCANADVIDLTRYESEAGQGYQALADGDLPKARELLRQAIARWRGPMLGGLPRGGELAARCEPIEAGHLSMVHTLADIHLQLGDPAEVIALLSPQLASDRLREQTYELLMRAYYQRDGVGAALAVYEAATEALETELGVQPGPNLRSLRHAAVVRDPELRRGRVPVAADALQHRHPRLPVSATGRAAAVAIGGWPRR